MISDTKLDSSRYEVIAMSYKENPKKDIINGLVRRKYMSTKQEQIYFIKWFKNELAKQGMNLIKYMEHPVFFSCKIMDKSNEVGEITVYK